MPKQNLVEGLVHKQNLVELSHKLESLSSTDIAAVIESLPHADKPFAGDRADPDRTPSVRYCSK